MIQLVLYTRADCPLCHEMQAAIERVARELPLALERVGGEAGEGVKGGDGSLVVGVGAVAEGRAQAFVSAGNTGACVLACAKHFRLLRGVRRAALASVYPRQREHPGQDPLALILDV